MRRLGAIVLGVVLVAAVVRVARGGPTCPCGFKPDALTGGCQVILGSVPCGTPGGNAGQGSSNTGSPGSQKGAGSGLAPGGIATCNFPPCDPKLCPRDPVQEIKDSLIRAQGKLPPPPPPPNCPNQVATSADMAEDWVKTHRGCKNNRADYSEINCKTLKAYKACMKAFPYSPLCGRTEDKNFYTAPCCKLNANG